MSARELLQLKLGDVSVAVFGTIPRLPPHVGTPDQARIYWSPEARPTIPGQALLVMALNAPDQGGATLANPIGLVEVKDGLSAPVLFEQMSYDVFVEWVDGEPPIDIDTFATGALVRGRETVSGGRRGRHYRLSLRDDVGLLAIRLHTDTPKARQVLGALEVEVAPRKLDFKRDYLAITADLSEVMPALLLSSTGRTSVRAGAAVIPRQVATHWYEMFRGIALELLGVVDRIALDPQRRLEPRERWVPTERARRVRPSSFERATRAASRTTAVTIEGAAYELPVRLPEVTTVPDYDAEGNRFIRWLMVDTHSRLQHLRQELDGKRWTYSEGSRQVAARWREEIDALWPQLAARLRYDWITQAGPYQGGSLSANLQAHPLYSRAFVLGRSLLRGLSAANPDLTDAGTKSISLIYEYWCFLKVADLLRTRADIEELRGPAFDVHHGAMALGRGRRSTVRFRHTPTGRRLVLAYNRQFATATFVQKPDVMLKIDGQAGWHAFDAKYRLDFSPQFRRSYGGVGPKREDVAAMHRYRDAIRSAKGNRLLLTACVLFPWNDEAQYGSSHRFHESLKSSGIGALPLLPSASNLVAGWLDDIIASPRGTYLPGH